ncbi:hypothetical protein BpHYR1_013975 [Brachionus plicatilis]|uniref:Uncharacterized protein n=1 Tax=Brachionus plicatilis TaxID=10195 RepID=A0A3M7SSX7_BRAPC|nr:hypothetical protein BpHYR1_013975 [Brachionus plicatilis]
MGHLPIENDAKKFCNIRKYKLQLQICDLILERKKIKIYHKAAAAKVGLPRLRFFPNGVWLVDRSERNLAICNL